MSHTFHIPVLGLGFSIDTPLKVAKYGISSVVSIVDDELIERMREFHLKENKLPFEPIKKTEEDHRFKRIVGYLNLLHQLINKQFAELKTQEFEPDSEITRYFELLPDHSPEKIAYLNMFEENDQIKKILLQEKLRTSLRKGAIDVNIMSKVDKMNYNKEGEVMGDKLSDALIALRAFAESDLSSSLILSAGMNPRLYGYLEEFPDFFPSADAAPKKKVVLKVSDFRSAFIQAKFLAKKGLWIHEFRIESGLNCGGHAFATEGYLLGPILDEFKTRREDMVSELHAMYTTALEARGITAFPKPIMRITVQGGIGTADEDSFLQQHYNLDGTGWGSPFLLVPEATNVDDVTLKLLTGADEDDFYISGASPLGIPFNNFKKSSAEEKRLERIAKGRPGSPCNKKYLVSNTEFTKEPICMASREYQNLKIKQLEEKEVTPEEYQKQFDFITEKLCLCQGLVSSVYIKNNIAKPREDVSVAICPGPNTAYFKSIYSLDEMVQHIYGKVDLLKNALRPNLFINELKLYVNYLKKDIETHSRELNDKKAKQLEKFKEQLLLGVDYYNKLQPSFHNFCEEYIDIFKHDLNNLRDQINEIEIGLVKYA